jgi:hypothetical protein
VLEVKKTALGGEESPSAGTPLRRPPRGRRDTGQEFAPSAKIDQSLPTAAAKLGSAVAVFLATCSHAVPALQEEAAQRIVDLVPAGG